LLTVPIVRNGLTTKLSDAKIDYIRDWRKSHDGRVRQAYARTLGGNIVLAALIKAWRADHERLIDLNLSVIKALSEVLGIRTPFVMASELGVTGVRTQRLLAICDKLGVTHYLSPGGSAEYLSDDGFERQNRVSLHLQQFLPHPYQQHRTSAFLPFMSVIDVIANLGVTEAAAYVRRPAFANYVKKAQ
jgi:hypothetical protein